MPLRATRQGAPRRRRLQWPGLWRKPAGRELLESAVALVVVAGVIGALLALFGSSSAGTGTRDARGAPAGAANAPSTGTIGTAGTAGAPGADPARPTMVPVLVLNNSRVHRLAARAAETFRAGGWPVRGTGNYRGRVPVTTIYFDAGDEAVARRFAARFPAVRRVLPRPGWLPGGGLTVVVTREFRA